MQKNSRLNTTSRVDPTRTTTLRDRFVADVKRRFGSIRRWIYESVVVNDCFALERFSFSAHQIPPRAFEFRSTSDKIKGFLAYLDELVEKKLLEVEETPRLGGGLNELWANKYIKSAYSKGVVRARIELKKAGYKVPSVEDQGGVEAVLGSPVHADRLSLLYTRTYTDLKGITGSIDTYISRALTLGMAQGKSPLELAEDLVSVLSGPTVGLGLGRFMPPERRAIILARTEIIRAHHVATIQEYRNWGVAGVTVKAEFLSAQDLRVCPICQQLQGKVFSLDKIENMIPVHPQCRCTTIPIVRTRRSTVSVPAGVKETSKFVPVRTLKEAEAYAKARLLTEKGKANFQGLALDAVNMVLQQLTDLVDKYGVKLDFITSSRGASKTVQEVLGTPVRVRLPSRSYAVATPWKFRGRRGYGIVLSQRWFSRRGYEELLSSLGRDAKSAWHLSDKPGAVIAHEYGHILDFVHGISSRTKFQAWWYDHKETGLLAGELGRYATTKASEAWAELFSLYEADPEILGRHPGLKNFARRMLEGEE